MPANANNLTVPNTASTNDVNNLTSILNIETLDPNLYRGVSPIFPRYGRVYGGQTVAQALVAAGRTVNSAYILHSLHSYFIRPGNDDLPILYSVDRARDGQSFCTRRVAGIQNGKTIFTMEVSFHRYESGLTHQYIMPTVPQPDTIQDWNVVRAKYANDTRFHKSFRLLAKVSLQMPFQMSLRRVTPIDMDAFLQPHQAPKQYMWMKCNDRLSDDRVLHQCALAYMSDFALLETSVVAHGTHWASASAINPSGSKIQPASIDHAMWFHQPFRADEWLLYECESPAASGGRGFNIGRFYTQSGQLVVSTAQEGLIRVRDWTGLDPTTIQCENPTTEHKHIVTTEFPTKEQIQQQNAHRAKL